MKKIIFALLILVTFIAIAKDKVPVQKPLAIDTTTVAVPRLLLLQNLKEQQKDLQTRFNNLQIMINIYELDTRDSVRVPK